MHAYTRPLRLGSGCPFKNPNPRPMIYQTPIIKKMSSEGHLALHWRKLRSFPRSYRKAFALGVLRGYNQSASSPLFVYLQLLQHFHPASRHLHKMVSVRKHFLYFSTCNFVCLVELFWHVNLTLFKSSWHVEVGLLALSMVLKCSWKTFFTSFYIQSACFSHVKACYLSF